MTRDHGTRARYVCGPDVHDQSGRGCRCTPCTQANRQAEDHRIRMKLYGQWQPYVDASPAREHLQALAAAGVGWKRAAELAGVATGAVSKLLYGGPGERPPSRGIRAETEQKLLAVSPAPESLSAGARTDAAGTRRRVQALVAAGYSQAILAERLGVQRSNFRLATCDQVTAGTARAVRELYDELWDAPPDESNHRAKISASRARNYARDRDWALPLAWDDDAIDDPAAKPAEGWRRSERTSVRSADLVEDAEFVREAGDYRTPNEIAMRLGVSRDRLDHAYIRAAR
jgi:transcriptional regulator with XRE-family HTH domain